MSKKPPKIPRQRTGSGGWPDRRRVPPPSKGKGCAVLILGAVGTITASAYGAAEIIRAVAA